MAAGTAASAHDLTVVVTNVRNNKGMVHVDLCREAEFLKDCALSAETPAVTGTTRVVIHNAPSGAVAIQATHDENNNKKVDRGLFGIPKEGIGFSNDAPISFGPPKWKAAMFTLSGSQTVTLRMRYMSGPSGPAH